MFFIKLTSYKQKLSQEDMRMRVPRLVIWEGKKEMVHSFINICFYQQRAAIHDSFAMQKSGVAIFTLVL